LDRGLVAARVDADLLQDIAEINHLRHRADRGRVGEALADRPGLPGDLGPQLGRGRGDPHVPEDDRARPQAQTATLLCDDETHAAFPPGSAIANGPHNRDDTVLTHSGRAARRTGGDESVSGRGKGDPKSTASPKKQWPQMNTDEHR